MTIIKLAPFDNMAIIALGFLGLTVLITLGLGVWVINHLIKKERAKADTN